jgi:hypothetical protein
MKIVHDGIAANVKRSTALISVQKNEEQQYMMYRKPVCGLWLAITT